MQHFAKNAAVAIAACLVTAIPTWAGAQVAGGSCTTATSGGPDSGGYVWTRSTSNFEDISGTGTALAISASDDASENIAIGFTFNLYGVDYTTVNVSTNGFLSFTSTDSECCTGDPIPTMGSPNALIAGLWEDLDPGGGQGDIYQELKGTAPNRRLVVQFEQVQEFPSGNPHTFQMVLFEGSDAVELRYPNESTASGTWTVGIENTDGTDGHQICNGLITLQDVSYNFVAAVVGDGVIEGAEVCDDGDTDPGDGCDASGQVENTYVCTGEPSTCVVACPGNSVQKRLNGTDYFQCNSSVNWSTAQAACTAIGAGWNLTRIDDDAENNFVLGLDPTSAFEWIGANDGAVEGEWRWPDGDQFWQGGSGGTPVGGLYNDWNVGEPNDSGGNEDCAHIQTGPSWNDANCTGSLPYVCEGPDPAAAVCGNGTVEGAEECDDMGASGCCSATCTFEAGGTSCGDGSDTECTNPDTCDGAGACQSNHASSGTDCGDTGTECVVQDSCDGSGACADNGFATAGTSCGATDDTACTDPDTCDGTGACLDNHAADGVACDNGLFCDGDDTCSTGACSVSAGDPCNVDETCNEAMAMCILNCGDGDIDEPEECDDGDANSDTEPDACRTDCMLPSCGDDVTDMDEECDDGDNNSDSEADACRTACVEASCGDGVMDSGETCDDGDANNDTEPDACRTNCAVASCGDGVVDDGEDCDDGMDNSDMNVDACRTTCVTAFCGDGVVDTGEDCDDGNMASDDGCSDMCAVEAGFMCSGSPSMCEPIGGTGGAGGMAGAGGSAGSGGSGGSAGSGVNGGGGCAVQPTSRGLSRELGALLLLFGAALVGRRRRTRR